MTTAPLAIQKLVQRFTEQRDTYLSGSYNETQVRRDFIDPFFEALGWDLDNKKDYAEKYRDVIHEDMVMVGNAKKAPDYSFRVGGMRKFFVEAKKPSVSISADNKPAFQLRRYGWSAKLPISILTDFEELAVYDCSYQPKEADPANKARLKYYKYTEYLEKWDEIAALFSKEAVMKGSFDRFADGKKKGTATVDEAFLAEIESWREVLAGNILKNNEIGQRELNLAVQLTIDRIIFLRICEDRGIEPYERLFKLTKGKDVYQHLIQLFKQADDRYNSGLFHFNPKEKHATEADVVTLKLKVDDGVLKTIIESLYPPNPYEFSVIPADILGQVYERFLGKVIQVDGKKAIVEEKPEVKKAGGVFYTPSYIVEYIVKNTVDKLLEGKKPAQVERLKIVDPACGSGSFLIVAYQHLLDWHLNYYMADGGPAKHKKYLQKTNRETWALTTQVRKKILLNNIYGVDIDAQAVEVTKLSLLLKVLEGDVINQNMNLFKDERLLPDLGNNIKCGNSLVGTDLYAQDSLPDLTDEDYYQINAFDWKEAFPEVDAAGGFDAVIGNPPYVLVQGLGKISFNYLSKVYQSAKYKIDTYQVFLEKAIQLACKDGLIGFIVPNSFLKNKHSEELRNILAKRTSILSLVLYDYMVFGGASVDTLTILLRMDAKTKTNQINVLRMAKPEQLKSQNVILQKSWLDNLSSGFSVNGSPLHNDLLSKIAKNSDVLGKYGSAYFGIQTFDRKKFVSKVALDSSWKPVIDGSQVIPYHVLPSLEYVRFTKDSIKSGGNPSVYAQDRIAIRQIGETPVASIVPANLFTLNTIYNFYLYDKAKSPSLEFILAIMLSKVGKWFWKSKFFDYKATFPKVKKEGILSIPIPSWQKGVSAKLHEDIVVKVREMMKLQDKLQSSPDRVSDARIKGLNTAIDELVYQAFGLSVEEIKLVEQNN